LPLERKKASGGGEREGGEGLRSRLAKKKKGEEIAVRVKRKGGWKGIEGKRRKSGVSIIGEKEGKLLKEVLGRERKKRNCFLKEQIFF